MRASFRSCSSSILVSLGTGALLVLIVVITTGGFTIRTGFFRFSAHSSVAALVVCVVPWLLAAAVDPAGAVASAARIRAFGERHGAAIAVVFAAAAAATSIAFGSYSAAGADGAGYISQAAMLAAGRITRTEPLAIQAGWPEAEWSFSPLGYRPGTGKGEIVPTYPPGLPLAFAAAQRVLGESGPYIAMAMFAAAAVLGTFSIGRSLHSSLAGAIAAALLSTSPIFIVQSCVPMSDVPATAWWALALACALSHRRGSELAAGALTGLAVLTRPNLVPLALVVATPLLWRRDRRRHRLGAFVLGGVPAAVVLIAIQWRIYGTPFASGHGSFSYLFSAANVLPNVRDYTMRLLAGEWPALLLTAAAALVTWRCAADSQNGSDEFATPSPHNAVLFAVLSTAAVLLCYLPYGVFPDWTYLRFLLPAFPAVFAAVAALTVVAASRLPAPLRGVALLAAVTLVCALDIRNAHRLQAFELRRNEGRYEIAGRYLASALPRNAVVIAAQESASVWHYTGRPVLRWDLLDIELDTAIERLQLLGRHPVLVVEDWEGPDLRRKFPASATAQLDWRPRADIGDPVRVRLFDPDDRLDPAVWPVDRLHVD